MLIYLAISAAVIGLGWWAVSFHVHGTGRVAAMSLTQHRATTGVSGSYELAIGGAVTKRSLD